MFMPTQTVFLKTTNLPEVILVTIALEKPWKFFKNETQKFYSGGFLSGGFVLGVFVGGICPAVFVLEPICIV